jgi:aspartyl-tRNA(Asn)/glutamyl-tRNA(Gln) amidotransferase subunit A
VRFDVVDVLVTPVSAVAPLKREENIGADLGTNGFREAVLSYTVPQNLCGLPSCVVRAGFDAFGLPFGVQSTGPPGWNPK